MKRYRINKIMTFKNGKLQLSESQAKTRIHNLKHVEDNIYEIVNPVQFKAGEEIGYDGEVNKIIASDVEMLNIRKKKE